MNELNKLKKFYDIKGWAVYKKLFSLDEINSVNLIINLFLKNKIETIDKKTRAINFTDDRKKNIQNINSFHELAKCEEIKNLTKKKDIKYC